jgi:hypothetical protein
MLDFNSEQGASMQGSGGQPLHARHQLGGMHNLGATGHAHAGSQYTLQNAHIGILQQFRQIHGDGVMMNAHNHESFADQAAQAAQAAHVAYLAQAAQAAQAAAQACNYFQGGSTASFAASSHLQPTNHFSVGHTSNHLQPTHHFSVGHIPHHGRSQYQHRQDLRGGSNVQVAPDLGSQQAVTPPELPRHDVGQSNLTAQSTATASLPQKRKRQAGESAYTRIPGGVVGVIKEHVLKERRDIYRGTAANPLIWLCPPVFSPAGYCMQMLGMHIQGLPEKSDLDKEVL